MRISGFLRNFNQTIEVMKFEQILKLIDRNKWNTLVNRYQQGRLCHFEGLE